MLCGWVGDVEWVEGIYATEADAELRCKELWTDRTSERGPDYARGLHKFGVEPMPLLRTTAEQSVPNGSRSSGGSPTNTGEGE